MSDTKTKGGQHRAPRGVSTCDDETDAERRERHRREHSRLDRELGERFNADLQAAIDRVDWAAVSVKPARNNAARRRAATDNPRESRRNRIEF
jgi:hypothetical protein